MTAASKITSTGLSCASDLYHMTFQLEQAYVAAFGHPPNRESDLLLAKILAAAAGVIREAGEDAPAVIAAALTAVEGIPAANLANLPRGELSRSLRLSRSMHQNFGAALADDSEISGGDAVDVIADLAPLFTPVAV